MPAITPWTGSPFHAQAVKIVDDAAKRIKTLKDDLARIQPKLNTYKKESLQKLIKAAKDGYAASLKQNAANGKDGPEYKYFALTDKEAGAKINALNEQKKQIDAQINAIKVELDAQHKLANTFRAYGDGKGGGSEGIFARMCEQYEEMTKAYEKELAAALKENPPNPARKV